MFDDEMPAAWNLLRRTRHWVIRDGLADQVATVRVDAGSFRDLGRSLPARIGF